MGANSGIEWTTHTWNAWEGCCKVSSGCANCYAETRAARFGLKVWGPTADRKPMSEHYWNEPLRWNRKAARSGVRERVFCASLADVFEGPETCQNEAAYALIREARRRLWDLIARTPCLDWLLLTKRPENILRCTLRWELHGWPSNVWIGTSVEDQEAADRRIPELLKVPAPVRFLSMEPLLGPVDLTRITPARDSSPDYIDALNGELVCSYGASPCPNGGIHWVIVGGESGKGARPMHPDWVRSLRDQCQAASVPFFFKQWGEWLPLCQFTWDHVGDYAEVGKEHRFVYPDARDRTADEARAAGLLPLSAYSVGKKVAGRLLDGRTWDELPEVAAK